MGRARESQPLSFNLLSLFFRCFLLLFSFLKAGIFFLCICLEAADLHTQIRLVAHRCRLSKMRTAGSQKGGLRGVATADSVGCKNVFLGIFLIISLAGSWLSLSRFMCACVFLLVCCQLSIGRGRVWLVGWFRFWGWRGVVLVCEKAKRGEKRKKEKGGRAGGGFARAKAKVLQKKCPCARCSLASKQTSRNCSFSSFFCYISQTKVSGGGLELKKWGGGGTRSSDQSLKRERLLFFETFFFPIFFLLSDGTGGRRGRGGKSAKLIQAEGEKGCDS